MKYENMKDLQTYLQGMAKLAFDRLLYAVFNLFKQKKCSHLFDPPDMQNRDENGNIKWKCCKCDKLFVEHCGLDILKHGKCTGQWGISK